MKIKELNKLNIDELQEKLAELRNQTRELRFSIANNQMKKVRELRMVKKDIARVLTIINSKRQQKEVKVKENNQAE